MSDILAGVFVLLVLAIAGAFAFIAVKAHLDKGTPPPAETARRQIATLRQQNARYARFFATAYIRLRQYAASGDPVASSLLDDFSKFIQETQNTQEGAP